MKHCELCSGKGIRYDAEFDGMDVCPVCKWAGEYAEEKEGDE